MNLLNKRFWILNLNLDVLLFPTGLNYYCQVIPNDVSHLGQYWLRYWLIAWGHHVLNHRWLISRDVLRHSVKAHIKRNARDINHINISKNYTFKICSHILGPINKSEQVCFIHLYCMLRWSGSVLFNSLRLSNTIWRSKTGSTLDQAIPCCLMAPSHYLN